MSARKRPVPRRTRKGREPRTWNRFWPAQASRQTWQHMRGRSICTRISQASRLLLGQRTLARHRTLLSGTWSTPATLAVCAPPFLFKWCYQIQASCNYVPQFLILFFCPPLALCFTLTYNHAEESIQYNPYLQKDKDAKLIKSLPEYLTDEITFNKNYESKFFWRLINYNHETQ